MDNTRPNDGHRARPYRSGGPVRAGSSIAGPVDVVGSAWWYSIAGSALRRGQHLGAIVVIGWSPLTASAGHRCGSGLPNVTVTARPGGGWSGCSGRVPAVRGVARLPVGFSVAGCRVVASGRLISEIRGKVFGKREVFLLDLRTLPGGAPARPARLGRLPEITDIPVFSATRQRTAVHHLPLPSRYMRQSLRCCSPRVRAAWRGLSVAASVHETAPGDGTGESVPASGTSRPRGFGPRALTLVFLAGQTGRMPH